MQINITGFLNGKNARVFMKELWELLLSAQTNIGGIPTAFLEKKKEEIRQRKVMVYHQMFFKSLAPGITGFKDNVC
jgi:serine/arginine repetitive matrix protein 1